MDDKYIAKLLAEKDNNLELEELLAEKDNNLELEELVKPLDVGPSHIKPILYCNLSY